MKQKTILLKLTGELITTSSQGLNGDKVRSLAEQIKRLIPEYQFNIVIGGGNFFRGAQQGTQVNISPQVSHYVGMLATTMNGLIIQDIFESSGIKTSLLSALQCEQVGYPISAQTIARAKAQGDCIIFTGGTGNPYFTTDTNAVLRALQLSAKELWKATKVAGVYNKDPHTCNDAQLLKTISYKQALELQLGIMDLSAFALAQQHKVRIRIFNIFEEDALLKAASDIHFGSTISDTI